jgi:hypothetical protein
MMTGFRVYLPERVETKSLNRIRSLLDSAVDDLVKCYRQAIDDGNEAPVVLVLIKGNMCHVGPLWYRIKSCKMFHLEARAIDDDLVRTVVDGFRSRWQAGCFPVLVVDEHSRYIGAYVRPGDSD